ncbi:MAG TPA: penicillin-binding protein [Candidatus Acidoferrum sp.]
MSENRAHVVKADRRAGKDTREFTASERLLLVGSLILICTIAVVGRLGYLQLVCHSEYLARAARQQQRIVDITPKRGSIYDRNMDPLAMSIPVDSVFAVPIEVGDAQLAAQLLSRVLGIPGEVLEAKLSSPQGFVWIARKVPPDKKEAVEALNLTGIYFQKENQRIYPKRDLAAHVLGFVDLDERGLAGVEYELDSQIRGKSQKIVVMADARQRWFDGVEAQRERGADVILTLDEQIQYIAERELLAARGKTHALAGTVVVMNPNDGQILALANWPTFNPNAANEAPPDARMNRAISALYEPGSTFKLITLAAAFDQGIVRPEEVFDCENGAVYLAGHRIRDHEPFGLLTVSEILAQSSDVGAIKIALRLGAPKFYDYIRGFGFGQLTGVDLPGESKGLLRRLENWSAISIGSISMGQEVGVTPIQLLSAVSAIANGGLLYRPRVVAGLRRDNKALPAEGPLTPVEPRRVIQPETAATLRRLMEGVILNGTGELAHLAGWTAAGKTGSAQKIDPATGRYSRTQLIASFTGFAPINNPAVAILVSLDSPVGPHEGGQVAAPVFKRIAEQVLAYLDVPRDVPVGPQLIQVAYKGRNASNLAALSDFTPTDFAALPDLPPAESSGTNARRVIDKAPAVTVAVDEGGDIAVPDFSGKTMREVTQTCLKLGVDPFLVGSGLAVSQMPTAGRKVRPGAKLTVQFGAPGAKIAKPKRRSRH